MKKGKQRRKKRNKKKSEKKSNGVKVRNCTWTFLSKTNAQFFLLVFSLFWKENFLIGQEKKNLDSTIYFPFSPPN